MSVDPALDLLGRTPILDGHNDLAWVIRRDAVAQGDVRAFGLEKAKPQYDTDSPRLREGRVGFQAWAAFVPTYTPCPAEAVENQIRIVRDFSRVHPEVFYDVFSSSDTTIPRPGMIGSILAVEGCVGMGHNLARLQSWKDGGVKLVTLCHTLSLDWVDSSTDTPRANGLSPFGRDVIAEMNRLGIIIDCSHASSEAAHQVLDISTAPIAFSHSNAQRLCPTPRNMPDDLLTRVPANDGIVMATFIRDYVSAAAFEWMKAVRPKLFGASGGARIDIINAHAKEVGPCPEATLQQVVDHIEYMAELVGRTRIGIGSDFYGVPTVLVGLEDASCYPFLIAELLKRGWQNDEIGGIASANFLRVMGMVENVAAIASRKPSNP